MFGGLTKASKPSKVSTTELCDVPDNTQLMIRRNIIERKCLRQVQLDVPVYKEEINL